jgi:hypothetical protein
MAYNPPPKLPGKSFADMYELTFLGNRYKEDFSDHLLLAIFWEETCFNNVAQTGKGTAVGFGQVEPSEFWKLKPYGLGLPATKKVVVTENNQQFTKTYATAPLSDAQAILATSCTLHCLRQHFRSREAVCGAYAGLSYAKSNKLASPSYEERLAIIQNWKNCESQLAGIKPFQTYSADDQEQIMKALNTARGFSTVKEQFRPVLFPSKP